MALDFEMEDALRLVKYEHITVATEIARRVGVNKRTAQRWFHRPEFKEALDACDGKPCPACDGTGTIRAFCYFSQRKDGLIKIGTSRGVKRLKHIARPLMDGQTLLAIEDGGFWREAELHKKFARYRKVGTELFVPAPELMLYISLLP
jgi:hypothetical protein